MESYGMFDEKRKIREKIKEYKRLQTQEEKQRLSAIVFEKVEQLPHFQQAKNIMLYWSLNNEVETHGFIEKWHHDKTIFLPVTVGDEMFIKPYRGRERMIVNNTFGIAEPDTEIFENTKAIDLVIVPGIAFDKENNRLGRGKAFYDRFLANTAAYKVGVCFDFQLLDKIPYDEHDIKMNAVISS